MDDELKRRIAAALDLPADAPADPDVVAALERDPAARAFAQGLYAIDEALASWPVPVRTAADDEQFAAAIEKRLGEAPWENTARVRDAIKPLSWDPTDRPPLREDVADRAADKPEHKPMAQSHDDKDNDDDLAGLAALARSSLSPGAPSATPSIKPGPSIHDDAMDESSGIVDIQKLAAIALKQSTPPPAEQLKPAKVDIDAASDAAVSAGEAPTAREASKAPAAMAASAVPASNAAAAERARVRADADAARPQATAPATRRGSPMVWMLPAAAAVVVGGYFGYTQLMQGSSQSAAPTVASSDQPAPSEPAPAPTPPTTATAAPAEAPPPPPAAPAVVAAAPPAQPAPVVAAAQGATEVPTARPAGSEPRAGMGAAAETRVADTSEGNAPSGAAAAVAPHHAAAHGAVASAVESDARGAERRVALGDGEQAAPAHDTAGAPTTTTHAHTDEAAPAAPAPTAHASAGVASATGAASAAGAGGGGSHAQSIDDLMNRAVGGDHPAAAAAAPAPTATLPARPSHAQVTATLSPLAPAVRACTQGATGTATVAMVIRNDGEVQTVSVSGPFESTVSSCIQGVVRRAHFPAFTQATVPLVYPFVIQPPH